MKKKILVGISLCLAIAISVYLYTYKDHRDISSETADYVVSISGLEKEFSDNGQKAFVKYQDKTILLTALVTTIDDESNGVVLEDKVFATFKDIMPRTMVSGEVIKIKGRFLGYDELLEVFKIDQSSIIQ